MSGRGGSRPGSGRKLLGLEPRKPLTVKLEPRFINWLKEHQNYNTFLQSILEQEMKKEMEMSDSCST